MNTHAEIDEAFAGYRSTGFGTWPWNDDAPTHGTDPTSFSDRIDPTADRHPAARLTKEPSS